MILNGKEVAAELRQYLAEQISIKLVEGYRSPCLVIITVGDDPASQVYVRNKKRACEEVGITVQHITFAADAGPFVIRETIARKNFDPRVDGIMVQLPLPAGYNEREIIDTIYPHKDVDGLTTDNIGKLRSGQTSFLPCTAFGIMDLLNSQRLTTSGKTAMVIGRSNIVGKPVADLLMRAGATITQCHSQTPKDLLLRLFATSDIVISAVGKNDIISEYDAWQYFKDYRHDFYNSFATKTNRIIIDVGMNRNSEGKLCGDFAEDFKAKYAAFYTPVPGGVGPMTVTELLKNTYQSYSMNIKETI